MKRASNPEVSVIVPTYNRAQFVLDAIKSILNQNYPSYEIVVVDDGSTDSTRESIALVSAQHPQIRYIYQENAGPSAARNRGISATTGAYIAFLDSDDLFEHGKLAAQVDYLRRNPEVGLVQTGFTKFNDAGERLGYRDTSWFSGWVYPQILLYWIVLIPPSVVMVRRDILDRVGVFDESLRKGEDLDLWRRIAREFQFGVIKGSLALVRVHPGNSSGNTLTASAAFEKYLRKAFREDETLSPSFQRRALSQMYGNAAYNLLSGTDPKSAGRARSDARSAIQNNPLNVHGYMGLVASMLPYEARRRMAVYWRVLRTSFMSRNCEL